MQEIINQALIPMINDGLLNVKRIDSLVYIKDFIDRVCDKRYTEADKEKELTEKYGASPDVITWGDYFQTELATQFLNESDEVYFKAVDTVKYDIISSWIIFEDKETEFFDWIENTSLQILPEEMIEPDEELQEIIHLKVLMDYFLNLGLNGKFTNAELKWHTSFDEAVAM